MKVSVIGPTHPFRGGISHYTSLLVRTLRCQMDVQFISYSRQYPAWLYPGNNDRDPSSQLIILEKPNHIFDAISPRAWWLLPKKVAEHRSDLVIFPWTVVYWTPYYYLFLKALKQCCPAAAVFICHNVVEHESSWVRNMISRKVLCQADFFITHSQWDKNNLLKWIGDKRKDQIQVSPHPVYEHLASPMLNKVSAREQLKVNSERVLLFFGFIREYKGLRYLLHSLPLILKKHSVHLLVAGEAWEDIQIYQKMIRDLHLDGRVTLDIQYIPNEMVCIYFAAADLVVVPYTSATQSGIVQLAYGFRKPVVVGKVGGIPEAVEHGQTGYLVRPQDASSIAEAVIDFYSESRESAMLANIEAKLRHHSWEQMAETVAFIGKQALASR